MGNFPGSSRSTGQQPRSAKRRFEKVLKRIKKIRTKDTCTGQPPDTTETIDTVQTDTGLAAWQACAGSVVLTTAIFVINFTTHEAVRSLNEDFNYDVTKPGLEPIIPSTCYSGVRENFDTLLNMYGSWRDFVTFQCEPESRTNESLYTCFMSYFFAYDQEFARINEFCSNRTRDGLSNVNYYPCLYYMDLAPTVDGSSLLVSLCSSLWPSAGTFINDTNCYSGVRQKLELITSIYTGNWTGYITVICNPVNLTDKALYTCLMSQYINFDRQLNDVFPRCESRTSNRNFLFYFPCLFFSSDFIRTPGSVRLASLCSGIWPTPVEFLSDVPRTLSLIAAENLFSASLKTVDDEKQFGDTLNYVFVAIGLSFVVVGAIVSVYWGYRVASIVGSILVAIGFVFASFIDTDDDAPVQILVGGIAGIGTAFLRLTAIVAVLEYFKELRMRAIVMSGLGAVLINFLLIGITFVNDAEFYWRTVFRLQLIPAIISLIVSFIMKPVLLVAEAVEEPVSELQDRIEEQKDEVTCITKLSEYVFSRELFTNKVFYLVLGIFFFDQMGRPIFSEGVQPMIIERAYDDNEVKVKVQPLVENIGVLIGLGVLLVIPWNQSKLAKLQERMNPKLVLQDLARNLTILAVLNIAVGVLCMCMPSVKSHPLTLIFSAVYGFTEGMFNSLMQDFIPDGFGRRHIRMAAGFLGFVAGIGSVIAGAVADGIPFGIQQNSSTPHAAFYFCGVCLFISGALSVLSRFVVMRDAKQEERIKKDIDKENRRKEAERHRDRAREGVTNPAVSEEEIEINLDHNNDHTVQSGRPEDEQSGSGNDNHPPEMSV